MALTCTIGGVAVGFVPGSLSVTQRVGEVPTCDLRVDNHANNIVSLPAVGAELIVALDGVRVFGGQVESPKIERTNSTSINWTGYTVSATGYEKIAARRNAGNAVFTGQHANDIIRSIAGSVLAGEGITYPGIAAGGGTIISSITFNYVTVAEAFDMIARAASSANQIYAWRINAYKQLEFYDTQAITSSFNLTDSSANFRNLQIDYDRTDYANRVTLVLGDTEYTVSNNTEIAARAAVEGGTGVYLKIIKASPNDNTYADGVTMAQAELDSVDAISRIATFETDSVISVGAAVFMNVTGYGPSGTFFVRRVSMTDYYPRGVASIRRQVECINGPLTRTTGVVFYDIQKSASSVDASDITGALTSDQIASVSASSIVGTISAANIGSVNASSIVGTISSTQIGSVNATSIVGTISGSQIASVNASSIVGTISSSQIASVSASSITGVITSGQIGSVSATSITGVIVTSQLANQILNDLDLFASTMRPIVSVSSLPVLPNADFPVGSAVILTTNGKLYRNVSNVWDASAAASDITGQLTAVQIGSVNTSSLVGLITAAQIDTINASDISGLIQSSQINTISATQISGAITVTQLAGGITADKITSVSATTINGTVTSSQTAFIGENLVDNPGFEDAVALKGWVLSQDAGSPAWGRTSSFRSGGSSAYHAPGTGGNARIATRPIPVVPGMRLSYEGWVLAQNGTNGEMYSYVTFLDKDLVYMTDTGIVSKSPLFAWVSAAASVEVPANAAYAVLNFRATNHTAGGWWQLDDVSLFRQIDGPQIRPAAISASHIDTVNADSIIGDIVADQIGSVYTTSLSGLITAAQIDTVNAGDITGLIQSSQINTVSATQITGTITASQIASIAATQITGTISATQIASITATQITGSITATQLAGGITADKIASVNAGSISGQIIASQIVSINATQVSGTFDHTKIGSVNAQTITINQIVDGQIANVNASKLTVGSIDVTGGAMTFAGTGGIVVAGSGSVNVLTGEVTATGMRVKSGGLGWDIVGGTLGGSISGPGYINANSGFRHNGVVGITGSAVIGTQTLYFSGGLITDLV